MLSPGAASVVWSQIADIGAQQRVVLDQHRVHPAETVAQRNAIDVEKEDMIARGRCGGAIARGRKRQAVRLEPDHLDREIGGGLCDGDIAHVDHDQLRRHHLGAAQALDQIREMARAVATASSPVCG